MKTELTHEEELLIDVVKNEYLDLFKKLPKLDKDITTKVINKIYAIAEYPAPEIVYCESLSDAQSKINKELGNTKEEYFNTDFYTSIRSMGFYAFYDYFTRIGVINNPDFNELVQIKDSGIWCSITFDTKCYVVCFPAEIHMNANDDLHNVHGAALSWRLADGSTDDYYFINDRAMPERIFKGFTMEEFIAEDNSDIKAGMFEVMEGRGEGTMLEFLNAEVVDRQEVEHEVDMFEGEGANAKIIGTIKQLEVLELYKTKQMFAKETDLNDVSPAPLAWLKLICPSTDTTYLIPSDSSFSNAIDAAKYHRPKYVPTNVDYNWLQRN